MLSSRFQALFCPAWSTTWSSDSSHSWDREVGGQGSRSRTAFINSSGWVAMVDPRTDDAGSGCDRIDVHRDGALRAKQVKSRLESALVGRLEVRPAAAGRGVGGMGSVCRE
jgi:hypothetical protein